MLRRRPGNDLTRNRNFTIFWAGQTLSFIGDAFSIVAMPLLILQVTGSLTQMGVVTALYGVGSCSPASPPGRSWIASTAAS